MKFDRFSKKSSSQLKSSEAMTQLSNLGISSNQADFQPHLSAKKNRSKKIRKIIPLHPQQLIRQTRQQLLEMIKRNEAERQLTKNQRS